MAKLIASPAVIPAAGNPPKIIEEFVGLVNTRTPKAPAIRDRGGDSGSAPDLSIARMNSPRGWAEPGQTPEFDEYSLVVRGLLRVETRQETLDVRAGRAILVRKGEWVRYSTPEGDGAEYFSVCRPAFSPETAHRDEPR